VDANAKYPIAYQVVELLLESHMANDLEELFQIVHRHPIGCMNDLVENKKDITLKLRTADICPACQQVIRDKHVPSGLVNQVLNTMEGIRQQMLFKERFTYHLTPSHIQFNLLHRKAILTDIQDMSIRLTPLEATVYYFFLKHPEGIVLNRLDEHEEELYSIYSRCSVANSDNNIAAMRNSIRALADPLENSLNEKISKIKAKFIRALGAEMASHYYIARDNGSQQYAIKIDRQLVSYIN
jgi:plasmid maintenance system killer protein